MHLIVDNSEMKTGTVLLSLACLWAVSLAAWFEYKPHKNKRVLRLDDRTTKKPETPLFTYSRTASGPVTVVEVDPDGRFVLLENTSSGPNRLSCSRAGDLIMDSWYFSHQDVNLDGWRIERSLDGKKKYVYTFRDFTLKAAKKLKIYALRHADLARLGDAIFLEETWGVGNNTVTSLYNDRNEEKASYIKKARAI